MNNLASIGAPLGASCAGQAVPLRLAFLLLVHHKPQQLQKLAGALTAIGTCFVHVDADTPVSPFLQAVPASASFIYLQDRCSVRWASFDVVSATLKLLRTARRFGEFDSFVLLSGVDYPIKGDAEILNRLKLGGEHIRCVDMPHPGHPLSRLDCFYVASKNRRSVPARALNALLRRLPIRRWRRGALQGMTASSGSQWWGLSRACVDYVLQFIDQHPEYTAFFLYSQFADEMFFQIIVRNSPFASDVRCTPTFDVWTRPEPPYPATLLRTDMELLRGQDHLFARKFDLDLDPHVFDCIDRELRGVATCQPDGAHSSAASPAVR